MHTLAYTSYTYHSCGVDVCGRMDVDISYDLRFELSVPSQSLLVPVLVKSQVMSVGIYGSPKAAKNNCSCYVQLKLNHLSQNDVKILKLTANLVMKIYVVQVCLHKLTSDLTISSYI